MKKFFLSIFFLFIVSQLNPILILVHGTWACFEEVPEEFTEKLGVLMVDWRPLQWGGQNTHFARIKAAKQLAIIVLQYYYTSPDEEVILVSHSHGGNVVNFASKLLYDPFENTSVGDADEGDFLEDFFRGHSFDESDKTVDEKNTLCETESGGDLIFKENSDDKVESGDVVYRNMPTVGDEGAIGSGLKDYIKKAWKDVQVKRRILESIYGKQSKKYKVDYAIYIATPICPTNYTPNMNVIDKGILLYSNWTNVEGTYWEIGFGYGPDFGDLGDYLQTKGSEVVEGTVDQTYPLNDRLTNIGVQKKIGGSYYDPYHAEIPNVDDYPNVEYEYDAFVLDPEIVDGLLNLRTTDTIYGSNHLARYEDGVRMYLIS
jgi:hypothetical protein